MAMNREQRRMLRKQGELGPDGEPVRQRRQQSAPRPAAAEDRVGPAQFVREVRGELRKVVWPTRSETINFSIVVVVTIIVLTALIAGFDFLFGEAILQLFDVN